MKESKKREYERLETLDDYFAEFERLSDVSDVIPPNDLDKICAMLAKALLKKYKYVIKFSAPFRRKQSFISKMAEKREEKLEAKQEERQEQAERDEEFRETLLKQLQGGTSEAKLGSPPQPALEGQVDLLSQGYSNLLEKVDEDTGENPQ